MNPVHPSCLRSPAIARVRRLAPALALLALFTLGADRPSPAGPTVLDVALNLDPAELTAWLDGPTTAALPAGMELRGLAGQRQLPVKRLTVLIPRDASVAAAELEGAPVTHAVELAGLPLALPDVSDEGIAAAPASAMGPTPAAGWSPEPTVRLVGDQFYHGYHLAMLEVHPIQVDPTGRQARLWTQGRVRLVMRPRTDGVQIVDRQRLVPGWRERVEAQLAGQVANPQALSGYALPPMVHPAGDRGARPQKTPSLASSPVQVLILTNEAMASEFQRLADHRTKLGNPAVVITIEDVLSLYRHGLDLAETLRLYIADAYSKWGVDYVLLGGDTEVIPTRYVTSTFYPPGGSTDIPADLYYAALTGNWNADGDAVFGEAFVSALDLGDFVDFTPEVAIGRATVTTLGEAQVFVDKVLAYEMPVDQLYQARALFASEVLFPQDWTPGTSIQLDGATFSEAIVSASLPCAPHDPWQTSRMYENTSAYPGSVPETRAAILDSLDTGRFGLFVQEGHGFYFNMSVGDANILASDADALTNGPNWFLLYALNCSSGAFDFNCLLERFLRNPAGGSVASLGSSRAAFPNTANDYQQAFFDAVLCDQLTRLGDAMNASRAPFTPDTFYNTSDRWTHFVYTLLGDPAMPVWTSFPRAISVAAPASVGVGPNSITVTVTDVVASAPLEGATVCLSKGTEDYAVGVTDAAGTVQLDFDAETAGSIAVWVSGADAAPTSRTIAVTSGGSAFLSVSGFSISDDAVGASVGNGNGRIEAGETVELTPLVRNTGSAGVGAGQVTLSTLDANLSVLDATAAFGALAAGGSAPASDPVVIQVAATTPDAHEATLELLLQSGAPSWTDSEVLRLESPQLEVLRLRVDDTATGDGDGIVDPLEDVDLILTLKNFGASAVASVTGVLSSASGSVTILDASGSWGAMALPLSFAENTSDRFRVRESDTASAHAYSLTLTDNLGRSAVVGFDLRRPAQVLGLARGVGGSNEIVLKWTRNNDADLQGYRVYRKGAGQPSFSAASQDIVEGSSTFRDGGLPSLERFEYYVVAVDNGGLEGAASATIAISTAPPEICDFPLPMGQESSGALAVHDIDGDGVDDMIIPSNHVYVIDGNCTEKRDGDADAQTFGPVTGLAGQFTPSGIAVGDLGGSLVPEFVASNWTSFNLYVYDAQGTVQAGWPRTLNNKTWTTQALGDLDGDDDLEIVTTDVAGWTYAFHHDGTEVINGDANPATIGPVMPRRTGENFGRTSPALFDVDGDGDAEILFGTKFQNAGINEVFYAWKADGTGNAPGWPKTLLPLSGFLASPSIADINNDGIMEIVQPCENDSLYVWRPDGTRVAPFPARYTSSAQDLNSLAPSVAFGDFVGHDGQLEMVVVETITTTSSRIRIITNQNVTVAGWPITVSNLSESSPVVGDIDGDGELDVVWGVGGGSDSQPSFLYAWNRNGVEIDGFPIFMSGFVRATPTICDLDGNGTVNIALASWDKLIHVWDMGVPYNPSLMPWPTFRGNVHRDGVITTTVSTDAPPADAPGARLALPVLHGAAPNPFNPSTTLSFDLPAQATGRVRLRLFDAAGRMVDTLIDAPITQAARSVRWNGRDAAGRPVASGVYHALLEVDGYPSVGRAISLIK